MRRAFVVPVAILTLIGTTVIGVTVAAAPASARTAGCYGAGCNGKNPSGLCDDGITVASKAVTDGILELRYSRSCKSNWGRYTPYWRTVVGYSSANPPNGTGIYARVTAWNPGKQSYGSAHSADINPFASSWSQMTDGGPTACTGVEVVHMYGNGDNQSQGWTWGPCY
jgi:hypothetical protein